MSDKDYIVNIMEKTHNNNLFKFPKALVIGVGIGGDMALDALMKDAERLGHISHKVKTLTVGCDMAKLSNSKADHILHIANEANFVPHKNIGIAKHIHNFDMVIILTDFSTPFEEKISPLLATCFHEHGLLTIGIAAMPSCTYTQKLEQTVNILENNTDLFVKIFQTNEGMNTQTSMVEAAYCLLETSFAEGMIGVDFHDVRMATKLNDTGYFGYGICKGKDRAKIAIEQALQSLPVTEYGLRQTSSIVYIIRANMDISGDEIGIISEIITQAVGEESIITFQVPFNRDDDAISVSIIICGMENVQPRHVHTDSNNLNDFEHVLSIF